MTVQRSKKQHQSENLGFLVARAFSKEFDTEQAQSVSKADSAEAGGARSKKSVPKKSVKTSSASQIKKSAKAPAQPLTKKPPKSTAKKVSSSPAYRVRVKRIGREIHVTYEGRAQSLRDWAEELGIAHHTLYQRIAVLDIPVREAFTRPVQARTPGKAAKKQAEKRSKPVYEAVPTPHNEELTGRLFRLGRQYFILYKRQYRSISDLAQEKGIDPQTLRVRLLKSAMSFKDILKP